MIPPSLKKYFWDIRIENVDIAKHPGYIISRLLEFGDEPAVDWLESHYTPGEIAAVVRKSRSLTPKSRNYWKLKYHLKEHA